MNHNPYDLRNNANGPRASFTNARHDLLTYFRWAIDAGTPRDELAQEIEATASAMRQLLEISNTKESSHG